MELRPYQEEARTAIQTEWKSGKLRTLLVLPTGCGKTIVFSKIIEDCVEQGERVLVLAHRGELLDQAADKLMKSTGIMCAVEKADQTAVGSEHRVVVASVQTMMSEKRLRRYDKRHFDTIIVDEAHHSVADSYQVILNYFDESKVLGVTATPDRGDKKNINTVFQSCAYEYSLVKAIKEGYLSPIQALTIPLEIDLSDVGQAAGDLKANELGDALEPYLELIAQEMWEVASDRKIVVFLPLISTSQKFTDILNHIGFRAVEVNGYSADRAQILADFDAGKYNVLCNSMLLTEGWDCPSVDCIAVLRPTKIRSLYSQMVGRGTRLYPGKSELLILDFLWHTERHTLCHPAFLVAKDSMVAEKMKQYIDSADGAVDLEEAEDRANKDILAEREKALTVILTAMKTKEKKWIDPLQFELSIEALDLVNYEPSFAWEFEDPTERQLATLQKFGIDTSQIDCKGKASLLLDRLFRRTRQGLSTPKQIRLLEKQGFQHVGMWTFQNASEMITRIAENNWRVPYDIDPLAYRGG